MAEWGYFEVTANWRGSPKISHELEKYCMIWSFHGDYVGIKSSRATSRVKRLKGEKTNVSRTISALVLRVLTLARTDFILEKYC
jgi:hypothetical protein